MKTILEELLQFTSVEQLTDDYVQLDEACQLAQQQSKDKLGHYLYYSTINL